MLLTKNITPGTFGTIDESKPGRKLVIFVVYAINGGDSSTDLKPVPMYLSRYLMHKPLFAVVALCTALVSSHAETPLKNGDFSKGRNSWEGSGKIVFLNDADEPTPEAEGGKPVLEVKLAKTQLTEIRQRFVFTKGERSMKVSVTAKASPDFVRNDDAHKWTKDITWEGGGWYSWSKLVYPKVDFSIRLDGDKFYYLPRNFKTKGEWVKLGGNFRDMKTNGPKSLNLVLPAGEGTIWIKSITSSTQ